MLIRMRNSAVNRWWSGYLQRLRIVIKHDIVEASLLIGVKALNGHELHLVRDIIAICVQADIGEGRGCQE